MERSHGRGIMIEGIMREHYWERNHGRGIMSHRRESWDQEAPRRHPVDTQEAPRRHPGGTKGGPRAPRSLQEVLGAKM